MDFCKHILLIGPYGEIGGVTTHVEQLTGILKAYDKNIRITRGSPFFYMLMQRLYYKPDVVIYNLSVYRNQILRNMLIHTMMKTPITFNILHLHGGKFSDVRLKRKTFFQKLLRFHLRRFNQIFCLTDEQYLAVTDILGDSINVRKIYNYVNIPDKAQLNKTDDKLNLLYIGRLHPLKGIREAVNAVSRLNCEHIRFGYRFRRIGN